MIKRIKRLWGRLRRKVPDAHVEAAEAVEVEDLQARARAMSRQERRALVLAHGWRRIPRSGSELWLAKDGHSCSLWLAAVDVLRDAEALKDAEVSR